MRVINLRAHPVVLEDGTVLAAAGTPGSSKEAELSESDRRRLVDREFIRAIDEVRTGSGSDRVPVSTASERVAQKEKS